MSRYIDADALKKRVSELITPDWTRNKTTVTHWMPLPEPPEVEG